MDGEGRQQEMIRFPIQIQEYIQEYLQQVGYGQARAPPPNFNYVRASSSSVPSVVAVPPTQGGKRIKLETDITEYLFKDEATKDFTIISGTGARVKCHKMVLKSRSKWFETMLQNDQIAEIQSGELKLDGMSDCGVDQLVRYLYGMEIPSAELTPDYALQLLQNGHAYELQGLVQDVGNILLEKDSKWFKKEDTDALLELYFFTQKLNKDVVMCRLNKHLLQIMSALPSNTISEAQRFQELSKEDSTNLFFASCMIFC